jgi:hypothetical protein
MKLQLERDRVRLQSQIECLLEEMRIKLSPLLASIHCGKEFPDNSHNDARHEAGDDEKNGFGPTTCLGGFSCGRRSTPTLHEK